MPAYRYLQVFTPPFITPGRNAVAIEPMRTPSTPARGLIWLEPGQEGTGRWGIRLV